MTRASFLHQLTRLEQTDPQFRHVRLAVLDRIDFESLRREVEASVAEFRLAFESALTDHLTRTGVPHFFFSGVLVVQAFDNASADEREPGEIRFV